MGPSLDSDPSTKLAFRLDWLVAIDTDFADDYVKGIEKKAEVLLHAARFVGEQSRRHASDTEIRVWLDAGPVVGCVSVTWEPGPQRYGFHLLDETLRDRLACIVFKDVPCMDAPRTSGNDSLLPMVGKLDAAVSYARVEVCTPDEIELGVER